MWLSKATDSEYARGIFGVGYGIESYVMTKSSASLKMNYKIVEDQKAPNLSLEKIL